MANKAIISMGMDKDWQAENDARTLLAALEIKNDKKRLKAAMAVTAKKLEEYKALVDDGAEEAKE